MAGPDYTSCVLPTLSTLATASLTEEDALARVYGKCWARSVQLHSQDCLRAGSGVGPLCSACKGRVGDEVYANI